MGPVLIMICLALIAGPLLLFSTINPAAVLNPVSSGSMAFIITMHDRDLNTNSNITLFVTDQVNSIIIPNLVEFDEMGFNKNPATTSTYSDKQT